MKKRYVVYWDDKKICLHKYNSENTTFMLYCDTFLSSAEAESAAVEVVESKRQGGATASLSIIKRNPKTGDAVQIINKKGEL
jgi:hypothetical protein